MSTIDKITFLLSKSGKTQKELTDYLGITKNAITDWKSGRIKSYRKHIPKIAKFFNVSADYLLNEDVDNSVSNSEEQEVLHISYLMKQFFSLSEEEKDEFLKLATMVFENQKTSRKKE